MLTVLLIRIGLGGERCVNLKIKGQIERPQLLLEIKKEELFSKQLTQAEIQKAFPLGEEAWEGKGKR